MNTKCFLLLVASVVASVSLMAEPNPARARGIGNRGGTVFRLGMRRGNSLRPPSRYFGPGFYAAPRVGNSRTGFPNYESTPWYYYRSGPVEYYRPYRTYYRTR